MCNQHWIFCVLKYSVTFTDVNGLILQGGDIIDKDGSSGMSIYGPIFEDESFFIRVILPFTILRVLFSSFTRIPTFQHDRPGILGMSNDGFDTNQSQFYITFAPVPHFDNASVAFGVVVKGFQAVSYINNLETNNKDHLLRVITFYECFFRIPSNKQWFWPELFSYRPQRFWIVVSWSLVKIGDWDVTMALLITIQSFPKIWMKFFLWVDSYQVYWPFPPQT